MRAALALALLALLPAGAARAQNRVIPAGSTVVIQEPGKAAVSLQPTAGVFLLDRPTVEALSAAGSVSEGLKKSLLQCQADVVKAGQRNQPPPAWWVAVKWAGVGGAVVGAFILGMALGG